MYKGKTALVVGLARSGVSAAKLLYSLGARLIVSDIKKQEEIPATIRDLKDSIECEFILGRQPDEAVERADFLVISPGIPLETNFVRKARQAGKKVMSEVELAYTLCKAPIIGITGTNGKTTTTSLVGSIFHNAGKNTFVVGNIGLPFTDRVLEMKAEDIAVVELSSFQLESIYDFRPRLSVILNITEDHLNRHKTMENYALIKQRIYKNQTKDDYIVLNADDEILSSLKLEGPGQVYYFSRKRILDQGTWVENDQIYTRIGRDKERICSVDQIGIPGSHNLENALASITVAGLMGIGAELIASSLKDFPGVEHRIERVASLDGVTFYNDSKATNPDAAIKAIEAMDGPTVLIAGGLDKENDFSDLIKAFNDKVVALVVLGQTAGLIANTAYKHGFTNIHRTSSIQEAARVAYDLALPGYNVLLSPACASWDMFSDYEERGRVFKQAVKGLRR